MIYYVKLYPKCELVFLNLQHPSSARSTSYALVIPPIKHGLLETYLPPTIVADFRYSTPRHIQWLLVLSPKVTIVSSSKADAKIRMGEISYTHPP